MCPEQHPIEAPGTFDLPNFSDRIPDLVQALRSTSNELKKAKPGQTYIPFFEDIYAVVHSLKGITRILYCPKPMEDFILDFTGALSQSLSGTSVCRKLPEASAVFQQIANALDCEAPAQNADLEHLKSLLSDLKNSYSEDISHEERMESIPSHHSYVNEFVSKKAREIQLLNMNHCVVEDEALLDDIPLWRANLNEALNSPEFGRGILVNFLPLLSPEGSRTLKLWAWVAASSLSRASLKQRIKEVMPKTQITKY